MLRQLRQRVLRQLAPGYQLSQPYTSDDICRDKLAPTLTQENRRCQASFWGRFGHGEQVSATNQDKNLTVVLGNAHEHYDFTIYSHT